MTGWARVKLALQCVGVAAVCTGLLAGPGVLRVHAQAQAQPPAQTAPAGKPAAAAQDEFVPVSELPPVEQLPAGPLVLGAYAFIWAVVLGYVFSISRRLGAVQRELDRLRPRIRS